MTRFIALVSEKKLLRIPRVKKCNTDNVLNIVRNK